MASTFLALHYHIVFGTKDRAPTIDIAWRPRLHDYLSGTIVGLGGISIAIGGVADHVHLLVSLKATHAVADVLRELKKASSNWVHSEINLARFAWQEGYAAFTVGASDIESVRRYIANQEEHHRTRDVRSEWMAMLERAGIPYDARYLE